jgi:hypothetical protein
MKIRVGFEMLYDFPQQTPMIMVLGTHFTRASDVIVPDFLTTTPAVEITPYRDMFGNWCSRMVAPAGRVRLAADGVVRDSGLPDPVFASAVQHAIEDLPADTLVYLLGSRYCETDRLSEIAWQLFENTRPGWARVQAICDFVHRHIVFGPRLCPSGHCVLPLHEHSGALLHRLSQRHRHAAALGRRGFRRLVRSLYRRALAHLRSPQQRAADRPHPDRAGPRCVGRSDHPDVWTE